MNTSSIPRSRDSREPQREPAGATSRSSRGVALLAVLWIVLLLSIVAGSLVLLTRSDIGLSRNLVLSARAEALAEGGIELAVLGLLDTDPETRWVADARPYRVTTESSSLEVSVQDETGRIDLNVAPPELLSSLLVSVGVEQDEAATLADRIADWRDEDDDARPNGAEQADYDAAGLDIKVGNYSFLTPDEVQRVPGLTTAIYARISPAVTVYSRRPGINPGSAPRSALLALPGVDPDVADEVIAVRIEPTAAAGPALATGTNFAAAAALLPVESRRFLTGGAVNIFSIRSRASLEDGATYVQEAVIELNPAADPPWRVHAWRPGDAYAGGTAGDSEAQ